MKIQILTDIFVGGFWAKDALTDRQECLSYF